MNQRDVTIDIAKGVAILFVVVGHLLQYNTIDGSSGICFNWIYSFHMPLFMLLSGYVAAFSRDKIKDFRSFVSRKAMQLLLPYALWSFIINPWILKGLRGTELISRAVDVLLSPGLGVWFLVILFFIQCYYFLFVKTSNKLQRKYSSLFSDGIALILILMTLALLSKMIMILINNHYLHADWEGVKSYFSIRYVLSFMAGYFMSKYFQRFLYHPLTLVIGLVIFVWLVPAFTFGVSSVPLQLTISLAASVCLLNVSKIVSSHFSDGFPAQRLAFIGKRTLPIYVTHGLFVNILADNIMIDNNFLQPIWQLITVAVMSFLVAMISIGVSEVLKRNRYMGLFLYGKKQ